MHVVAHIRRRNEAGHQRVGLAVQAIAAQTFCASSFEQGFELAQPPSVDVDSELEAVIELAKIRIARSIGAIEARIEASDGEAGLVYDDSGQLLQKDCELAKEAPPF